MPELTPPNFEITVTSGKSFALVSDVLQMLLERCAQGSSWLHQDMDRLVSRSTKNQIRNWVAEFLNLGLFTPDAFDLTAIEVFNTLLRNQQDVRGTVTRLQEVLRQYMTGNRLRDSHSVAALRGFADCLPSAFNELELDRPFPCCCVTIARGIVQGIDDGFGHRLGLAFRAASLSRSAVGSNLRELAAGEVFLNRRFNPNEKFPFFCKESAFNLAHAEDDAGQLTNVRRIGNTLPLTLQLRSNANEEAWSLLSHKILGTNVAPLRVGFACLGPKRDNFRLASKRRVYRWIPPRHEPFPGIRDADSLGAFFGVEYSDQDVLTRIFDAADKHDVDLLIYPELCFSEAAESQVRQEFLASPRRSRPQLLVLGSRHIVAGDGPTRKNSLTAVGRTGVLQGDVSQFTHDKIGTFGFRDGSCYYVEDISRSRRLTALDIEGMPVVLLICKDVLQQTTLDTITALSPQRLIVVAMSDKTEEFSHHFCEFAARYNTTTFFSCFSPAGQTTAGVFGPGKHVTAVLLKNAIEPSPASHRAQSPGSIQIDPQTVGSPCLAVIELPILARNEDPRFHSNRWFEISYV